MLKPKRPLQIETKPTRVMIFTNQFMIKGIIHTPIGGRLTDFLNKTLGGHGKDIFIAVTDAECFCPSTGKKKLQTKFISIHKDHIQMVFPCNDVEE